MSDEDGQYYADLETGRAVTINPFGIALYELTDTPDENGRQVGLHQGVTGSDEAAQRWVHGGPLPDDLIIIYPPEP